MEYDDTFNTAQIFAIDIRRWDQRHRDFWTRRLGRRYLLSVVPTKSRPGRILEIGAAWYNRYQKDVVGKENELTVIDIKEAGHPDIVAVMGMDRYVQFDMTRSADQGDASGHGTIDRLQGAFDEIRSWGVLSHYPFSPAQCERYLANIALLLKPGGQAIFKLDIDTHKVVKQLPSAGFEFLEGLIHERFAVVHTDVLNGSTPGRVHYVQRR